MNGNDLLFYFRILVSNYKKDKSSYDESKYSGNDQGLKVLDDPIPEFSLLFFTSFSHKYSGTAFFYLMILFSALCPEQEFSVK